MAIAPSPGSKWTAAKRAGKPVFAFLVDPNAPWTKVKEQDRLVSEPSEKAPEIVKAVQKLQEFKVTWSASHAADVHRPRGPGHAQVTVALANFTPRQPAPRAHLASAVLPRASASAAFSRPRRPSSRNSRTGWGRPSLRTASSPWSPPAAPARLRSSRSPARGNALGPRRRLCLVLLRRSAYGRFSARRLPLLHRRNGHAYRRNDGAPATGTLR